MRNARVVPVTQAQTAVLPMVVQSEPHLRKVHATDDLPLQECRCSQRTISQQQQRGISRVMGHSEELLGQLTSCDQFTPHHVELPQSLQGGKELDVLTCFSVAIHRPSLCPLHLGSCITLHPHQARIYAPHH